VKKYQEALALYRVIDDPTEQYIVPLGLGMSAESRNDATKAVEHYDQALHIALQLGDKFRQGRALQRSALAYEALEQWEKALQTSEESLTLFRASGEKSDEATIVW